MKVLIVEDSLVTRRLVRACLEKWQYEVQEAEHGAQAWEFVQHDHYPLVLTDWLMPEMDGLELTRRIRSCELPGYVYIILLTAKAEKADLVAAMDAGADDFLVKPFDPDELRVRMRAGERIIALERRLAEQNRQLREAQAALVQSEKLASLGQLAAGMAHEINNPVAYVTNNLAVLNRDLRAVMELLQAYRRGAEILRQADPQLAAQLAELEEDADLEWVQENLPRLFDASLGGLARVRNTVQNLREFARLDAAELDELDLNAALTSTLDMLRRELDEQQISLSTHFAPLPPVVCRPSKIHQVFLNLLLNAIQASDPQGRIEVRTAAELDHAVVEVRDHGCGIDPAHLPRVFEPFFTTKAVGRGAGLGLSICYGIIRDHGGSIDVDSQLGRGSTFRVRLPFRLQPTQDPNR
ncbi:MAG: response regulator [Candidatus Anammoximicrobium sp.]|nr:response regulator [Candidatus Anammoximicrobium sp.]